MHVTKAEQETVFEIILLDGILLEIRKRNANLKNPLTSKEEKDALLLINKFYQKIIEKWVSFFVLKKKITMSKITKKIAK